MTFVRDAKTKALLSQDLSALNKYKRDRDQCRKIEMLSQELKFVRSKLDEVVAIIEKNQEWLNRQ